MKIIFLLSFFFCFSSFASEIVCPNENFHSVVADPAIVSDRNGILVMGTGDSLRWKSIEDMMSGHKPQIQSLRLFHEVNSLGKTIVVPLNPDELPWDLQFYTFNKKKYLYGGVMSPREGSLHAKWPDDNISRRIKVATYSELLKGWVFKSQPLFGNSSHTTWTGHSYGQQIIKSHGKYFVLHEMITSDGITEIFIRKLVNPYKTIDARKIIGIQNLPIEDSRRADGGQLLEGPRYRKLILNGRAVHLIYFSTGDFPTKNYATRLAYSVSGISGPYKVLTDTSGSAVDLTGQYAFKNKLYGVGRASPFTFKNSEWIIFHGAKEIEGMDHTQWPQSLDTFRRCLFATPVKYKLKRSSLFLSQT